MDPYDIFSPTRPRTPTTHPHPYTFPTSFSRDDPPRMQFQIPSPFPHLESLRPQPNPSSLISPTSPTSRPQIDSPLQDDGNVLDTKPYSESEIRAEGPSRPPMPPRPPNIRIGLQKSSYQYVKEDSQVEVPKSKFETCIRSPSHPSRRPDLRFTDVEDWLAGVAAKDNDDARIGAKGRKKQAPKPNRVPPPGPPRPSTPPSPSPAPRPRPQPAPPATNVTQQADPGPMMRARGQDANDVTAQEMNKGKSSFGSVDENTSAQTITDTPAPRVPGIDVSETRMVDSLTEMQKTLASYKTFRDRKRGKNSICFDV